MRRRARDFGRLVSLSVYNGRSRSTRAAGVRIGGETSLGWGEEMSEHVALVAWRRETPDFAYTSYNRDHDWTFDGGTTIRASAAPAYLGNESCVDPEEAFVASLSSCHMLTFLAIAAKKGFVVDSYRDRAVGVLEKDASGRLAIVRATLRPEVKFGGAKVPTVEELRVVHDQAHHACFIANSVKTEIAVEIQ